MLRYRKQIRRKLVAVREVKNECTKSAFAFLPSGWLTSSLNFRLSSILFVSVAFEQPEWRDSSLFN